MSAAKFPASPSFSLSWEHGVELAKTEHEVIELARGYLAQLDPAEISALPPLCRPRKLVDASDVSSYAFDLVRYACADGEPAERVHKLAAFFSSASMRL
jgi:hypothetical protein